MDLTSLKGDYKSANNIIIVETDEEGNGVSHQEDE